jgi:hypothetical protein
MLQPDDVARATIGLLTSPLTGQVLDVRRGEPVAEELEAAGTVEAETGSAAARRSPLDA